MNIDKAIEILDDFRRDPNAFFTNNLPDAIGLGIEAMKRLKIYRNRHPELMWESLPGETKD